jgi:CDGSH-type Zn-finger protein/truncated hemoglobin YjbI
VDTATQAGVGVPVATDWTATVRDLVARAQRWAAAGGDLGERLRASVIRPLRELSGAETADDTAERVGDAIPDDVDAELWDAVLDLAGRWAVGDPPIPAGEALAALMDLALTGPQVGPLVDRADRRAQLVAAVASAPRRVIVRHDGPYLCVNVRDIADALGLAMPLAPVVALCRCGVSARKPLCDGSHARIGFHPEPDPHWLPDRRRAYPAPAATVQDNRRLCARSELCSTRLPTVFHHDETPFVTAGAGRLDEVVRAVLQCPSGALSMQIAGQDVTGDDGPGAGRIAVTRDGPYYVTGDVPLEAEDGSAVSRGEGAPVNRFALCRCGQTRNTPLCSGRHRDVHFTDPLPDRDRVPTLFEWAGGMPAFQRLMRRFYETLVPADPLLAPLFGAMPADHPERVAAWVAEVFGAPDVYSVAYGGFQRMMSRHLGGGFSEPQRARFVQLIVRAADEVGLPADPEFRAAFVAYFEWGSRIATETSQPGAKPPRNMQMPQWNWIRDAVPGSRPPSFARHEQRPPLVEPAPSEAVRFAVHIRPQFRKMDRLAMMYAFDLWDVASVRAKAPAILARLRDGTMPVDGSWPPEAVELFARWIDTGMSD